MSKLVDDTIKAHPLAERAADRSVFWSHGGMIVDNDDRKIWSVNQEICNSFIGADLQSRGESYFTSGIGGSGFADLSRALGQGPLTKDEWMLPSFYDGFYFWHAQEFWREMSQKFTATAKGDIYAAVDNAPATTSFRLFEYPLIADNPDIKDVYILTGKPVDDTAKSKNLKLVRKFKNSALPDAERRAKEVRIYSEVMCDSPLRKMSKEAWLDFQKQKWFDDISGNVINHLNGTYVEKIFNRGGYLSIRNSTADDLVDAKAAFIAETIMCLRELSLQQERLRNGKDVSASIVKDKERLQACLDILRKYPELGYTDEPATEAEKKASRYPRCDISRLTVLTRTIGGMLLRLDDSLDADQKTQIWGKHKGHDHAQQSIRMKWITPEEGGSALAKEQTLEQSIAAKIRGLPQEIEQALKNDAPQIKTAATVKPQAAALSR